MPPAAYFFCLARKSRQKDAPGRVILRAHAREFLAAPRPERPDGRKISIFPIAYTSDKCTTRIYRQTVSISVLLISGILGGSCSCTTCCRGRWRAQPSATKERYGCGPPLAGAHRPACPVSPDCLFCGDTATVASQTHFFCLARKSGQKEALDTNRIVPRCHRSTP